MYYKNASQKYWDKKSFGVNIAIWISLLIVAKHFKDHRAKQMPTFKEALNFQSAWNYTDCSKLDPSKQEQT